MKSRVVVQNMQRIVSSIRKKNPMLIALVVVGVLVISGVASAAILEQGPQSKRNSTLISESEQEVEAIQPDQSEENASNTQKTEMSEPTPISRQTGDGKLVLSNTSFTVTAGKTVSGLTISADDGSTLEMPAIVAASSPASLLFNAGTNQKSWSGLVEAFPESKPGTYTLKVFAQRTSDAKYYYGSITVKITPKPTLKLKLYQSNYNSSPNQSHYISFTLSMTFEVGYNHSIKRIVPESTQIKCGEPEIYAGQDVYIISCALFNSASLPPGTLKVRVHTSNGDVFTTSASYKAF